MIKFENTEVMGWEAAIRGMRNPMNSWERSDSETKLESWHDTSGGYFEVGPNDHDLMMRLAKGGPVHAKYRRMITVYVDITAPLYWWKEFDTYKVGTVANSCSTMHKIAAKEFTLEDFSTDHLDMLSTGTMVQHIIPVLNINRQLFIEEKDKKYWWQMIQLLPSSYNQKRTVMMNYEVLANIYKSRRNHKLDEWSGRDCFKDLARDCNTCVKYGTDKCHNGKEGGFIQWIETLPYSELITGKEKTAMYADNNTAEYGAAPAC